MAYLRRCPSLQTLVPPLVSPCRTATGVGRWHNQRNLQGWRRRASPHPPVGGGTVEFWPGVVPSPCLLAFTAAGRVVGGGSQLWNGSSRLLSISRGAAPPLSEVDLRLWRWEMGRRWLSRADLARPLAGVMCGERWRRSLGDARRASTAWAPAVGRIASSSRRSTLRGGCSVSRDGGEAHLGGVRCGPAGSTAVVCVTLASPALPRRRFGTCSRSGGSWMA
jgi:hypothetical protein